MSKTEMTKMIVNEESNCVVDQVFLLPQNAYLTSLMTMLRDIECKPKDFFECFERVADQLLASALDHVPYERHDVTTPTGLTYSGVKPIKPICGVSILRAGASFENPLRRVCNGPLSFGKILIQRNEETCLPVHLYSKLPNNISSTVVFLLEPMLATGGSAGKAIEIIKAAGVAEEDIIFVNAIASQAGIRTITSRFPSLKVITAAIDKDLTVSRHIAPGLGDFGDRFYGMVE